MAKTIKELSKDYIDGKDFIPSMNHVRRAYEDGANVVVSRIKRYIRSDVIIPISDREANHILDMICDELYNLRKE